MGEFLRLIDEMPTADPSGDGAAITEAGEPKKTLKEQLAEIANAVYPEDFEEWKQAVGLCETLREVFPNNTYEMTFGDEATGSLECHAGSGWVQFSGKRSTTPGLFNYRYELHVRYDNQVRARYYLDGGHQSGRRSMLYQEPAPSDGSNEHPIEAFSVIQEVAAELNAYLPDPR